MMQRSLFEPSHAVDILVEMVDFANRETRPCANVRRDLED
jgi:hypothetical protein